MDRPVELRPAKSLPHRQWTRLVVYALLDGPLRHGELKRTIEGISQKMLTQTLRSGEADGLVQRTVVDVVLPHVHYRLTPLGQTLSEPLVAICQWAMDHLHEMQQARATNARSAAASHASAA